MKVYGLAGASGSGKGTVGKIFSEYGIPSVDTDKVYHNLIAERTECTEELLKTFGTQILNPDNSVNRKKLSEIVFNSDDCENKLKKLNKITHYHILKKTREILKEYEKGGAKVALVDAPLLFESQFHLECDGVISVISEYDLKLKRIVARDGISADSAQKRLSKQLDDNFLILHSDYIIRNNGSIEELKSQVLKICKIILNDRGDKK